MSELTIKDLQSRANTKKPFKIFITIISILAAVIVIGATMFVFSIVQMFTPDRDRHTSINWAKEQIDISSAGEVLVEKYDHDGGVFAPTWFRAELKGEQPYERLFKKVQEFPNVECERASPRPTNAPNAKECKLGPLSIQVRIEDIPSGPKTVIIINDSSNGKKIPDESSDGDFRMKDNCDKVPGNLEWTKAPCGR